MVTKFRRSRYACGLLLALLLLLLPPPPRAAAQWETPHGLWRTTNGVSAVAENFWLAPGEFRLLTSPARSYEFRWDASSTPYPNDPPTPYAYARFAPGVAWSTAVPSTGVQLLPGPQNTVHAVVNTPRKTVSVSPEAESFTLHNLSPFPVWVEKVEYYREWLSLTPGPALSLGGLGGVRSTRAERMAGKQFCMVGDYVQPYLQPVEYGNFNWFVTDCDWRAAGETYASYDIGLDSTHPVRARLGISRVRESIYFFWAKKGKYRVSVTYTPVDPSGVPHPRRTHAATVEVLEPYPKFEGVSGGVSYINGTEGVQAISEGGDAGIVFQGRLQLPARFAADTAGAKYCIIQLCKLYRSKFRGLLTYTTGTVTYVLDDTVPYTDAGGTGILDAELPTPKPRSGYLAQDVPAVYFEIGTQGFEVRDAFKAYMMFRHTPGSAWVPVKKVEWGWNANALRDVANDPPWNPFFSPGRVWSRRSIPNPEFPEWDGWFDSGNEGSGTIFGRRP